MLAASVVRVKQVIRGRSDKPEGGASGEQDARREEYWCSHGRKKGRFDIRFIVERVCDVAAAASTYLFGE